MEDATITFEGDFSSSLAAKLKQAFEDADSGKSKLSEDVLAMAGMSGRKYRRLINNLVESMDEVRYLETGSLKGSTSCSAMYGNKLAITCIENWHWDYRDLFKQNTDSVRTDDINFNFIESDFRAVDYTSIGDYNVYMFDGPHEARDQYDGVVLAQPALDDTHVLIVDDWNWENVQHGTDMALRFLGSKIVACIKIITNNYSHENGNENSDWHNGYFIAIIDKKIK